jgi:DNA-binding Lrp family transcriptional regulator
MYLFSALAYKDYVSTNRVPIQGTFYIKGQPSGFSMPKHSQAQISEDEKKILVELQKNSNQSIDTIAHTCGFSRQKVWRSIKRLEQDHIIWGYAAIVDEEKQDRRSYVLTIKKTTIPIDEKTARLIGSPFLQEIGAKEGIIIEHSLYCHGEYDWIIIFTADDLRQAKRFSELLYTAYPGYIAKVNLTETLFWTRKQRIFNPEAKKFKELLL